MNYFYREEIPGKRFFLCPRYNTVLSDHSCADRYRMARNGPDDGPMYLCRGCSLGAEHAGETFKQVDVLGHLCVRCHEHASRLLRGAICIACYNRQREVDIGRNAKGAPPKPVNRFWALWLPEKTKGTVMATYLISESSESIFAPVIIKASCDLEAKLTMWRRNPKANLAWSARDGVVPRIQMSMWGVF